MVAANAVMSGATAGLLALVRGDPPIPAFLQGAGGGALAYMGKTIATGGGWNGLADRRGCCGRVPLRRVRGVDGGRGPQSRSRGGGVRRGLGDGPARHHLELNLAGLTAAGIGFLVWRDHELQPWEQEAMYLGRAR